MQRRNSFCWGDTDFQIKLNSSEDQITTSELGQRKSVRVCSQREQGEKSTSLLNYDQNKE